MYAPVFIIAPNDIKKELKNGKRKKFKKEYNIKVYAWIKQLQPCQMMKSNPT